MAVVKIEEKVKKEFKKCEWKASMLLKEKKKNLEVGELKEVKIEALLLSAVIFALLLNNILDLPAG